MRDLEGMHVIVAGGGAIGSAIALKLAGRGAAVTLADPAPLGANASGVAAGMLAPAMEAALDPISGDHFLLLKAARDRWPEFVEQHGLAIELHRCGAVWTGDEAAAATLLATLGRVGANAEPVRPARVQALVPGTTPDRASIFTPEDWRLEPSSALRAFRQKLRGRGGEVRRAAVRSWKGREADLTSGETLRGDALVLATGMPPIDWPEAPVQTAALHPIKGQILRYIDFPPLSGPILRGAGIYLVPSTAGVVAGATMEFGRDDVEVDRDAVAQLRSQAERVIPALSGRRVEAGAAVRAGTGDGLPLVGHTGDGLWLALGARRNGWLLAPLIAEMIASSMAEAAKGEWEPLMEPGRYLGAPENR